VEFTWAENDIVRVDPFTVVWCGQYYGFKTP